MLIPMVLFAVLMLAQPAIVLFDRMVMEAAASEGCRMLETLPAGREDEACAYIERRLAAIPATETFHAGSWEIEVEGGEESEAASVRIAHGLRPLPLIGAGMGLLGMTQGGLYRQEVSRSASVRDEWVVVSEFGADAHAWMDRWEEKA